VKLLLDTQIAIWALVDRLRIGEAARELIQDGGNQVFVSVASVWEIAIKYALHKRRGAPPFSGAAAIGHFGTAGGSAGGASSRGGAPRLGRLMR